MYVSLRTELVERKAKQTVVISLSGEMIVRSHALIWSGFDDISGVCASVCRNSALLVLNMNHTC